jgi:DNA-binding NtrC family response regulator
VRELRNVIERAVVVAQSGLITPEELPDRIQGRGHRERGPTSSPAAIQIPETPTGDLFIAKPRAESTTQEFEVPFEHTDLKTRLQRFEATMIEDALARTGGNQSLAAELLAMPRRTLVHKIKIYAIERRRDGRAHQRSAEVMLGPDGLPLDFRTQLERYEETLIRVMLDGCGGNLGLAARKLGIPEHALAKKTQSKS